MTKTEMEFFIEEMGHFNDIWTLEEVERVYGNRTLEDALADRRKDHAFFGQIMETVLNSK